MFWTIVGAVVVAFFVFPFILQVVMSLLSGLFDTDGKVGCIVLTIIGIVLLVLIF